MSPATSITNIGFVLRHLVNEKAAMKMATFKAKVHGLSCGVPKFSFDMSNTAAAAIRPMMAGRKPAKMLFTKGESLCFSK